LSKHQHGRNVLVLTVESGRCRRGKHNEKDWLIMLMVCQILFVPTKAFNTNCLSASVGGNDNGKSVLATVLFVEEALSTRHGVLFLPLEYDGAVRKVLTIEGLQAFSLFAA
jgi:hypothetical protein